MFENLNETQRKTYNGESRFLIPAPRIIRKNNEYFNLKGFVFLLVLDIAENILRTDLIRTLVTQEINLSSFKMDAAVIVLKIPKIL